MSPTIYVMITAGLCIMLEKALPTATRLLYADDRLLWIPGNLEEIKQQSRQLKEVTRRCAEFSGEETNLSRSRVVFQGAW